MSGIRAHLTGEKAFRRVREESTQPFPPDGFSWIGHPMPGKRRASSGRRTVVWCDHALVSIP